MSFWKYLEVRSLISFEVQGHFSDGFINAVFPAENIFTKGDRLISNMSPLIVKSKNSISTIGSPGADRISSAIAQVITNFINGDTWRNAINKPRFHVNEDGDVRAEPDRKSVV